MKNSTDIKNLTHDEVVTWAKTIGLSTSTPKKWKEAAKKLVQARKLAISQMNYGLKLAIAGTIKK